MIGSHIQETTIRKNYCLFMLKIISPHDQDIIQQQHIEDIVQFLQVKEKCLTSLLLHLLS